MEVSSSHQVNVFFIYVLSGLICGTFFDIQRLLRRIFAAGSTRTLVEDFIFAVFTVFMTIAPGFIYNNGEMRYYQIIGILCGGILYAAALSRTVTKILYFFFRLAEKIIVKPTVKICLLLIAPVKWMIRKIKKLKYLGKRVQKKLSRHSKKRRKALKKRIKML